MIIVFFCKICKNIIQKIGDNRKVFSFMIIGTRGNVHDPPEATILDFGYPKLLTFSIENPESVSGKQI